MRPNFGDRLILLAAERDGLVVGLSGHNGGHSHRNPPVAHLVRLAEAGLLQRVRVRTVEGPRPGATQYEFALTWAGKMAISI